MVHMLHRTDAVFSPSHKDMQLFEGGHNSSTTGLQIISLVRGFFFFMSYKPDQNILTEISLESSLPVKEFIRILAALVNSIIYPLNH